MTQELLDDLKRFAAVLEERAPAVDVAKIAGTDHQRTPPRWVGWRPAVAVAAAAILVLVGLGAIALLRPDAPPSTDAVATLPAGVEPGVADAVGTLRISSIDVEIAIISASDAPLRQWPMLTGDSTAFAAPGVTQVWGQRTLYGQPFFRLDELVIGDEITVETPTGTFAYAVSGVEIVEHGTPLAETDDHILVLSTYDPEFTDERELRVTSRLAAATDPASSTGE